MVLKMFETFLIIFIPVALALILMELIKI